ncbi:helix-turn-helix domain-containing protein [Thiospirochaeta perfilievii]|nr:AraC family transcriptional regulator [Thiospirochaeta perfilievii]
MIYFTGHYNRQIKLLPEVSDFGFIINKTETVYQTFNSCNFSFILRGDGWYVSKGQKIRVTAPAILIQWPGEANNYGPDDTWDEYFIMYKAGYYDLLTNSGIFNINKPVLKLNSFQKCSKLLYEIEHLLKAKNTIFPADRLDLLCWRCINESFLYIPTDKTSSKEKFINKIAENIKADPLGHFDFNLIASSNGMALPTFRRYWLKYIGVAPNRFIGDLKLSLACDLLINSDLLVSEIARELKFQDPLYFSRFFKKKSGFTPREYRETYKFI